MTERAGDYARLKALVEDALFLMLPDAGDPQAMGGAGNAQCMMRGPRASDGPGAPGDGGLLDAMRYTLGAPGKRLRPVLLLMACEAAGGDAREALPYACAIEYIHCYSLIHDDLPAMDDDDLRRGLPTNHRVFGEAMAILAGDGLLNAAFEAMHSDYLSQFADGAFHAAIDGKGCNDADGRPRADAACEGGAGANGGGSDSAGGRPDKDASAALERLRRRVCAGAAIARAAGSAGMVAGQAADMEAEGQPDAASRVGFIHLNKTAALIRAAAFAGGCIGGADERALCALWEYGECLGLAFQIADDLIDAVGESGAAGKATGKDAGRGKATYPMAHGAAASRDRLLELSERARRAAASIGSDALAAFAGELAGRDR